MLLLSLLVVLCSSDLLLLDFLDEESLGEAEVLLAASRVSGVDRMSFMILSPGTGDPGSAVVLLLYDIEYVNHLEGYKFLLSRSTLSYRL